jgi:hypothetical protein
MAAHHKCPNPIEFYLFLAFRVATALRAAARRLRVIAAFLAAARRFRVCAAFCPGVNSSATDSSISRGCIRNKDPLDLATTLIALRDAPQPLDHHHEDYPALVPTANPANAPSVDAVADRNGVEQAQELGLWMAPAGGAVKASSRSRLPAPGSIYFFLRNTDLRSGQNSRTTFAETVAPIPAVPHSAIDRGVRNSRGDHNVAKAQLPYEFARSE